MPKSKIPHVLAVAALLAAVGAAKPAFAQPARDAGEAAPAAPAAPEGLEAVPELEDPAGAMERGYEAVKGGNWREVAALALALVVFAARRWGKVIVPGWFRATDRGGVILVFALAFLGAGAHAVLAGADLSDGALWKAAFNTGLLAIGGFVGLKKIVRPKE